MSESVHSKLHSRNDLKSGYYTYEGEKPATNVWGRRFLAHLCDVVIEIILGLCLYAACTAIANPLGYSDMSAEYQELFAGKIQFLIDAGIMRESEGLDGDGNASTMTDTEMAEDLVLTYFDYDTLVTTEEDGTVVYNDLLMEFYCHKLGVTVTGVPGYEESLTAYEYFEILDEEVNDYAGVDIFVYDEDLGLPQLNGETVEGHTYSYRSLLFNYMGRNPDTGEEEATAVDTSEVASGVFSSLAQGYLNMRVDAATIAISSDERVSDEYELALISTDMVLVKAVCLAVGYMLAFIIYRGVCYPIFKYGRTVSKRILGYYVVDFKRSKAKWWQLVLRTAVEMIETYWVVLFGYLMIFGTDALTVPLMKVGTAYVEGIWFILASLLIYLGSCICAFIARNNMSSLHDFASHTACIALEEGTFIKDHLQESRNVEKDLDDSLYHDVGGEGPSDGGNSPKKDSDADRAMRNLEGE